MKVTCSSSSSASSTGLLLRQCRPPSMPCRAWKPHGQLCGTVGHTRAPRSLSPCAVSELAATTTTTVKPVMAVVQPTSWSSRKVFASVEIAAPLELVWGCLTNYSNLHTFIPSLVENKCLERREKGCRLLQVGAQDVALGIKFSAKVIMDVDEHPTGISPSLIFHGSTPSPRKFPYPETCLQQAAETRDISFLLVDGDFQDFRGVWRLQSLPPHSKSNGTSDSKPHSTYLSYAVFVQPQQWLPVGLIQGRIQSDVCSNLEAVRAHAEALRRAGKRA